MIIPICKSATQILFIRAEDHLYCRCIYVSETFISFPRHECIKWIASPFARKEKLSFGGDARVIQTKIIVLVPHANLRAYGIRMRITRIVRLGWIPISSAIDRVL